MSDRYVSSNPGVSIKKIFFPLGIMQGTTSTLLVPVVIDQHL